MTSLVKALPGIWNVTMLVSIFWLIFSILGVSLFKGKLQTCDADPTLDKDACLASGGNWIPDPYISFDSTWESLHKHRHTHESSHEHACLHLVRLQTTWRAAFIRRHRCRGYCSPVVSRLRLLCVRCRRSVPCPVPVCDAVWVG